MTYEQIIARLDKRDRDYKTELADLDQRIQEAGKNIRAAQAAMDTATRNTDPDAYRKAKREYAYHHDAVEMLQARRDELKQPPITEEEYKEMTAAVLDDMEAELGSVMEWAVEVAEMAAQYAGEIMNKRQQAETMLRRLAKAAGCQPEKLRNIGPDRHFDAAGAVTWLRAMYTHFQYEQATGKKVKDPTFSRTFTRNWA